MKDRLLKIDELAEMVGLYNVHNILYEHFGKKNLLRDDRKLNRIKISRRVWIF